MNCSRILFSLLLAASLSACVSQGTYQQEVQQVDTLSIQNQAYQALVVEGYTDNAPIGSALRPRYPTNWELSAARACDVVRYLQAAGIDPRRLAASGFGEYQPVAPNDTPAGRSQNRRIDIVLMDMSLK
jgi:chemotaxis protein MotB